MSNSTPSLTSKSAFKITLIAIILVAIQAVFTPINSLFGSEAKAQVIRNFPVNAVRGSIAFLSMNEVTVDGNAERLAPGVRVRDPQNMMLMTAALIGNTFVVNFKRENISGLVSEIWLLSPEEVAVKRDGEKK